MILESIISTSITLLFAIIFDKMIETLFFLIFFIMLRIYVGGLHLNKFWQCCLLSNLVIFFGVFIAEKTELNLYAPSSILIDSKTGKVLYEHNANEKMYPASTTKILTAIIVLENCENLQDTTVASYQAVMDVPSRLCNHAN